MRIPFQKYWTFQKKYLTIHKKRILLLLILLVANIILQIANPQIIRYYIDTFGLIDNGLVSLTIANHMLIEAAFVYIAIAIFQQLFYVFSVYLSQNIAWDSTNALRLDLTKHCMDLDMSFHNKHTPGELIERIDGDITVLSFFFPQFTLIVLLNVLLILGVLTALFIENWRLGVAFSLFASMTLIVLIVLRNLAVPYWKSAHQSSADLFGFVEESLSGTEDIRALGATQYIMQRFHSFSKNEYQLTYKAVFVSRLTQIATYGLIAIGATLVFVTGIPLFNQGIITIGTIFLINYYAELIINPIRIILRQAQDLQRSDASIDRIDEFFSIEKKISDPTVTIDLVSPLTLEFDRLTFGYLENEFILQDITFTIQPGKILGLIGRTGSGKTTVARLIFRLYKPNRGNIRLNGIDTSHIPLEELRKQIAYVTQKVELFQASLRDNITFFDRNITDEQILQAIKDVGLDNWYEKLPEGLDTKLSSDGSGLSAGEAQLLALSRAFLKNPNLIILDEASSRLDPATERLIEKAVDKLLKNRTAIIIAHRLSTLNRVDDICLIETGRIIEYGPRHTLANDSSSRFYQLLQTGKGIKEVLA
ncbi:MAG: ABC transporter ATP-binding protein [Promethearchaeota archaeon]